MHNYIKKQLLHNYIQHYIPLCPIGAISPYPQGYLRKIPMPKAEDSQNFTSTFFVEVPKEAPSVTNIVWAPSVASSMALSVTNIEWAPSIAPSVAPSVIISLICFPVPPPIFEVVSLHPDFRLA